MAHILFIPDTFLPNPSANGYCTYLVMHELKRRGHELSCVCSRPKGSPVTEEIDGIRVYRVRQQHYARMSALYASRRNSVFLRVWFYAIHLLRRVVGLFILPIFPDISPVRSYMIFKAVESIHKERAVDCVIGVFRAFCGVKAALYFKRSHPETVCGAYYLDLIEGQTIPKWFPTAIFRRLCNRGERRAFEALDFLMMAKSGAQTYSRSFFERVSGKIHYIDFPVFRDLRRECDRRVSFVDGKVNIVYAGTLDRAYRNPEYFLSVASRLGELGGIIVHVYGRNNCQDVLDRYLADYPSLVRCHGLVGPDVAIGAMLSSDVLLNISNTKTMVPSKIFELFSTGKPIINVVANRDDPSLEYFERYPLTCNLYTDLNVADSCEKLKNFLRQISGESADFSTVSSYFSDNTPDPACCIIESYLRSNGVS